MATLLGLSSSFTHSWVFEPVGTDVNNETKGSPQNVINFAEYSLITLFGTCSNVGRFLTFKYQNTAYKPASGKRFVGLGMEYQVSGTPGVVSFFTGTTDVGFTSASNTGFDTLEFMWMAAPTIGETKRRPTFYSLSSAENKYICAAISVSFSGVFNCNLYGIEIDDVG